MMYGREKSKSVIGYPDEGCHMARRDFAKDGVRGPHRGCGRASAMPVWQAGYMHADRFSITNKKLAKGVGSIHARKRTMTPNKTRDGPNAIFATTKKLFDILVRGANNQFMLRRTTFAGCLRSSHCQSPSTRSLEMTQFAPEQFAAAQKTHFDTLFSLTNKVFEGAEELTLLNLQAAKSILAEAQETAQKVLSVKDPQDLVGLHGTLTQPVAEKAQAYSRHVYEILTSTQAEFVKVAEAQFAEYSRSAQTFIDDVAKNAPAGSEAAVALLKSTIATANTTYDAVNKATKQAVEVAESNLDAASTAASKAAKDAAAQASRAPKAA
jgi:phasin family protein